MNLRLSGTAAASPEHGKRKCNVDRLMWISACVHASSIRASNSDQQTRILLRLCARVVMPERFRVSIHNLLQFLRERVKQ